MPARSGSYPIARRIGEIERLRIQAEAMKFDAGVLLDRIGIGPGWRCLDLGCGPGAILPLLSARVGATGRVVGLDADPVLLTAQVWGRKRLGPRGGPPSAPGPSGGGGA